MAKSVILIAGNIGAGKTEFGRFIEKNTSEFACLFNEDAPEGERVVAVPEFIDPVALELFYRDRKAHSEIFEDSCLMGRISRHLKAKYELGIHIFDRGMIEGAETFCKNSCEEGYLTHDAHQRYIQTLMRGLDQLDRTEQSRWLERIIVYLKVSDIEILQERQRKRGTKGEIIPPEYLERINVLYDDFFRNINSIYTRYGVKAPEVLLIDASKDFNEDKKYFPGVLEQIVDKMKEMKPHETRR